MKSERIKVRGAWMTRLLCVGLLFLFTACTGDRCKTPFGEGGTFDVNMPDFAPLANVGGSMMINRGHKGIMVTRISYSEFVAFEGACPNNTDELLVPDSEWGNSVLVCPVCSSRFNALDGSALDSSATPCPLYQYNTVFDGRNLTIFP